MKFNACPVTLDLFPDASYLYDETIDLNSELCCTQNSAKYEHEHPMHDAEDLDTDIITDELPNRIDKVSLQPYIGELPRSNESKAFELEMKEEEQIPPQCSYDRDQDMCNDPNFSPHGMKILTTDPTS